MRAGLVYDAAGNLYMGGYENGYGNARRLFIRTPAGVYNRVIGSETGASSADCTTPGCAVNQNIQCLSNSDAAGSCVLGPFDQRFAGGAGRLLFAEGNRIRFVKEPTNPASGTYGTLENYTFPRSVGAFLVKYVAPNNPMNEAIDRVYYISSDSKLYCHKFSAGADANCDDSTTPLGPPVGYSNIQQGILREDAAGTIYVMSKDQIYSYSP
ncbi:MAG: hypothetical protein EOP06_22505 [Proteobacteria bacterium]|nr:MAG: hypothetical protein EOP06_22505 [Pseudomonadota bacterium]